MNVKKVSLKLEEINVILEEIKKRPISESVVLMKNQKAMRERIKQVFALYGKAIENKKNNIPRIHKELKEIISTLKKWVERENKREKLEDFEEQCGGEDFITVDANFKGFI